METSTNQKLNPAQIHILQLLARPMSDKELNDIKKMLSNYYDELVSSEMDKIWEKRGYNEQTIDDILETHRRTTYKK